MRITQAELRLDLINTSRGTTTDVTVQGEQELNDIILDELYTSSIKVGTFEHNIFILDGTFQHLSSGIISNSLINFLSESVSSSTCEFASEVSVATEFLNSMVIETPVYPQNIVGITIDFGYFRPEQIEITYTLGNSSLLARTFDVTSDVQFFSMTNDNVIQVKIKIIKTRFPYQYAYMQNIRFGRILYLTDEYIKECHMHEEVDLISKKVVPSTFEFDVFVSDTDWELLQKELFKDQKLYAKIKYKNDSDTDFTDYVVGIFYLDHWERKEDKISSLSLVSALGILDKVMFESEIYAGTTLHPSRTLEFIVAEILQYEGIANDINDSLKTSTIKGIIPTCTKKEALQRLAFSVGAVVEDNRDGKIKIYKPSSETVVQIEESRVIDELKDIKNEVVTGFDVTYHTLYEKPIESPTYDVLFSGNLPAGTTNIVTTKPIEFIETDWTITSEHAYSFNVTVDTAGKYEIFGLFYETAEHIKQVRFSGMDGYPPNILKVEGNQLINDDNVTSLSNTWTDYYLNYRLSQEFPIIFKDEVTDSFIFYRGNPDYFNTGYLISQDIDLSGGLISKCKTIAVVKIPEKSEFMGQSMYGGSRFGLI